MPTHRTYHLSDRCLVIRSNLSKDPPDWRVAYFGFDSEDEAQSFAQAFQLELEQKHGPGSYCITRKAKRLLTQYEVKVRQLSRFDVLRCKAIIEGTHWFDLLKSQSSSSLLQVVVNGKTVGSITADSRAWIQEKLTALCQDINCNAEVEARQLITRS